MDWPLAGIAVGIVVFTCASAYGVINYIEADVPPASRKVVAKSAEPVLTPKSALPVFVPPSEAREQFSDAAPLINLTRPQGAFQFEKPAEAMESFAAQPPPKEKQQPPPVAAKLAVTPPKQSPPPDKAIASLPPPQAPAVRWRVVATANASYFNLGGHIDGSGTVDSLASPHLRDAFKAHRNFNKLPPDIKNHILTQNISLPKIAPYRALLGIDDKTIEREQAVRFEQIGGPRSSG